MRLNFTEGSIHRGLFLFTIPLICSNWLQQCYNLVDTWVVGQYIGKEALAAVGSAYTLMTFILSILLGLCMSHGVLVAMEWGRNRWDRIRHFTFLSFVIIGGLSVLLCALMHVLLHPLLGWLQVPVSIQEDMSSYLRWIFWGIPAIFLYNFCAQHLRALGDSKIPFYFLGLSTLLNIVFDLWFVLQFSLGIDGVAIATVLAQWIAGLGIVWYTAVHMRESLPTRTECYWDTSRFKEFGRLSWMTCLQQSVMNFGILLVQGRINQFGASIMAAFAVAVKIDAFAYLPLQDFGNAFSTFIAQNRGARKQQRIQDGLRIAFCSAFVFSVLISAFLFFFSPMLLALFIPSTEQDLLRIGTEYLRIEGSFYFAIGWLFLFYGYFRSMGSAQISLYLTILSLGTRVVLAYVLSAIPAWGVYGIWWSVPIGWMLADAAGVYFLFRSTRKKENMA